MRRRPYVPPPAPLRLAPEPALRLYCEKRKVDFGVLHRGRTVRVWAAWRVHVAIATLTFGCGHAFWQVRAWVIDKPDREDRLYNNLTRALDRKLRELGWLRSTSSAGLRGGPTPRAARPPSPTFACTPARRR